MYGRAVVIAVIVLNEAELFELVDESHAANEQVIMLMGEVEFVVVGSEEYIAEQQL